MVHEALIEREPATDRFLAALEDARAGSGSLMLVAGEAGVGKTSFVEAAAGSAQVTVLRGAAAPSPVAYGPIVGALRGHLRAEPAALDSCGPLRSHLALLLPELGEGVDASDQATLFEAIRCALVSIASRPAVVVLDDLQWSDSTTLELLAYLAAPLGELPVLVVGVYRSDEVTRTHPVRRLRDELRRRGALGELTIEPLSASGTAELAARVFDGGVSPSLARELHRRTNGIPFFVEELTAALETGGLLGSGAEGAELALDADLPLPATIRDAVLLQIGDLSDRARASAEAAAVAGPRFEFELLADLGCDPGIEELLAAGLLTELDQGRGAFRHPLARDAIYEDVPWVRRRDLHRRVAVALEAQGAEGTEAAAHWLQAREGARALEALRRAMDELAAVHAHRDATRVARQILELWPEGERIGERIAVIERYARLAELAGELSEAGKAQREVVASRRTGGDGRALADAERRLATIYELQGDRERALGARKVAAGAFAANGLPGEAASERLTAAGYLQSRGEYEQGIELTRVAGEEAERAQRVDLRARAMGLRGVSQVKGGDFEGGMETIAAGLELALDHELTLVAAEVYQRLGTAREISGDYEGARDALATAVGFCEADGGEGMEYTCMSCMAYVLRELGDWDGAADISEDLIAPGDGPDTTLVADGVLGAIRAFRGEPAAGRPLLAQCLATASRLDVVSMGVDSAAALAWTEELEGDPGAAAAHCRFLLERWERSEDHHYAVWGLRWAACFFARRGSLREARACAEALSGIAARTGHPDALAALAHALGEIALADGEVEAAAAQIERAVEIHEGLEIPFERAQIQLRAGVALAAAERREEALERLRQAHATARELGAEPIVRWAAATVAELGESVEERLGRRAAAEHENGGLTKRELEVMRHVASGRTNREIAGELVLSTRTIDMHVRNILFKLDSRSRAEATAKAGGLGLLE